MRSVRIKRVEFREKCEAFHYSGTKKTVPVNNALSELRGCPSRGEGVLPYMGYIGMCRCEGYGFQAVYSRIGYINQSV